MCQRSKCSDSKWFTCRPALRWSPHYGTDTISCLNEPLSLERRIIVQNTNTLLYIRRAGHIFVMSRHCLSEYNICVCEAVYQTQHSWQQYSIVTLPMAIRHKSLETGEVTVAWCGQTRICTCLQQKKDIRVSI